MLSVTPIRVKNVSFQLPGSTQRATSAPITVTRKLLSPPPKQATPIPPVKTTDTRMNSPQPDLIADILDQPGASKKEVTWNVKESQVSQEAGKSQTAEKGGEVVIAKGASAEKLEKQEKPQKRAQTAVVKAASAEKQEKPEKRVQSGQSKVMKAKWSKGHRSPISTALSTTSSTVNGRRTSQIGQVTSLSLRIRDETNVACLDYARWMKHDMAKLREHVIKIEEEIRLGNKAKTTLDTKIFDLRKCLSVNQQSVSAQQKKTHKEV